MFTNYFGMQIDNKGKGELIFLVTHVTRKISEHSSATIGFKNVLIGALQCLTHAVLSTIMFVYWKLNLYSYPCVVFYQGRYNYEGVNRFVRFRKHLHRAVK